MNRLKIKNEGQTFLEFLLVLPTLLVLLWMMLQYSFILFSQRIVDWACFYGARSLLVETRAQKKIIIENNVRHILGAIPFKKSTPFLLFTSSADEVMTEIRITIYLTQHPYELHQKFTLFK